MRRPRARYQLNVAGDFYVEDGCCTRCGVPAVTAPQLFGGFALDGSVPDGIEQCRVKRQPTDEVETAAMLETMASQEFDCIRYPGSDPQVVSRLREAGDGRLLDS